MGVALLSIDASCDPFKHAGIDNKFPRSVLSPLPCLAKAPIREFLTIKWEAGEKDEAAQGMNLREVTVRR